MPGDLSGHSVFFDGFVLRGRRFGLCVCLAIPGVSLRGFQILLRCSFEVALDLL